MQDLKELYARQGEIITEMKVLRAILRVTEEKIAVARNQLAREKEREDIIAKAKEAEDKKEEG